MTKIIEGSFSSIIIINVFFIIHISYQNHYHYLRPVVLTYHLHNMYIAVAVAAAPSQKNCLSTTAWDISQCG